MLCAQLGNTKFSWSPQWFVLSGYPLAAVEEVLRRNTEWQNGKADNFFLLPPCLICILPFWICYSWSGPAQRAAFVRKMCSETPAETFIFVVLVGRKATLMQLSGEAFAATIHINLAAGPPLPQFPGEQLQHAFEPGEQDSSQKLLQDKLAGSMLVIASGKQL